MKLIMSMKDKGFDYATIGKAMDMMGVDSKINQAKSNMYQQQFINALGTGNYAGAGAALSNLAEINKPQAAMLASYFPSFKDNWNVDVARQNAAQAHNWNRADKKEDMAMQNAYRQADLRQKIQLQEMQRQRAISSLVGIGMPQAEAEAYVDGRYRKPASGSGGRASTGSGVKSSDGNHYTVNGQPVKQSSEDLELKNQLENNWHYAWEAVNNPDNNPLKGGDGGADDVDKFTRLVIDNSDKMSPAAYSHYYSLAAAAQFLREKAAGHENKAAELFAQISPEIKATYLSQY